jgi:hypothetical protein
MPTLTGTREDRPTYLKCGWANGRTGCGHGRPTHPERLACRVLLAVSGGGATGTLLAGKMRRDVEAAMAALPSVVADMGRGLGGREWLG